MPIRLTDRPTFAAQHTKRATCRHNATLQALALLLVSLDLRQCTAQDARERPVVGDEARDAPAVLYVEAIALAVVPYLQGAERPKAVAVVEYRLLTVE